MMSNMKAALLLKERHVIDPQAFAEAKASGKPLPSNHSPFFAPDVDPALHTGIEAEVAVLRNLLNTSPEELHKFTATPQP